MKGATAVPEYLAPGVYVEETSFRAKSIEGVSTSTTAFAGPTRRGPFGETPELITSFGDFERVYGGLENLSFGPNYMAHAVRSYFNEGGSRLYISRVFLAAGGNGAAGHAASSNVIPGAAASAEQAGFMARFPGSAGNGRVGLRQVETPVTRRGLDSAPEGSLVRIGGGAQPSRPARLSGGTPPFSIPSGSKLLLTVGDQNVEVTFRGEAAEVVGAKLPANVNLDDNNRTLRVTVDGVPQSITLPAGSTKREELAAAVNREIRGGYARLTDDDKLAIGSDRRGKQASVAVEANAAFGFASAAAAAGNVNPNNNVGDILRVTADEINALLTSANIPARAAQDPETGALVVSTTTSGAGAKLGVRDAEGSARAALGLTSGPPASGADGPALSYYVKSGGGWRDSNNAALDLGGLQPGDAPQGGADLLTLTVATEDGSGNVRVFEDMGFDPRHPRYVGNVLSPTPSRRTDALENLFAFVAGPGVSALELRDGLFATGPERLVTLSGGDDGVEPTTAAYEAALAELQKLDDISIVAAPGHSSYADFQGIQGALITHVDNPKFSRYRIAVLDTQEGASPGEARGVRSRIDSTRAAIYYPWVIVSNPLARPGVEDVPSEIALPPSGFICGIYARNDVERGVAKAPANEVVRSALRFERELNFAQQEMLNPLGVNCLRYFPGRGYRVWGARTATSDPEWKYVNVRRYFNYLEASIDRGTQWAVFENNGERLWQNVRDTITGFLYNEWISGRAAWRKPGGGVLRALRPLDHDAERSG